MRASQTIFKVRRQYNQWVADETLEDYALRFTAVKARRFSIADIGKTAWGATAFLALEALAATATLQYGFINAFWAITAVSLVIFLVGIPICYNAAKHGLDIDLLTRSAGFGYLGSTITSLIYAAFTFIFFAIEAAILASALEALFGIPPAIGYILCAVAVVPIVTHGITAIRRFQIGTQSLWLGLQLLTLTGVVFFEIHQIDDWTRYTSPELPNAGAFNLAIFGAASALLFAMIAQIGEQVDYLRFMPPKTQENRKRWWFWLIVAGPGWIFTGYIKMLFGSFLAFLAIGQGIAMTQAVDPVYMYQLAFNYITQSPAVSLVLASLMVIISQMKINVTNAYAGSIAWSNFFSRLTHNHPGRVVWLVFNVVIALILMELGIYRALEAVLGVFALIAISWLGCVSADLTINKYLGYSPSEGEFKRAHLYDINPVGFGGMCIASVLGVLTYLGLFGEVAKSLAHFLTLASCFVLVPLIAKLTNGKYYIARANELGKINSTEVKACVLCANEFETKDTSYCPAYQGTICSLCCSLDSRCLDACKPEARVERQLETLARRILPPKLFELTSSRIGRFIGIFTTVNVIIAVVLSIIYFHIDPATAEQEALLNQVIITVFFMLMIVFGVVSWLFLLAHESREVAQQESNRQSTLLIEEIEAHKITDASLQDAKDLAERANQAKSRYLSGISHELRTPLQSMLGYAQLMQGDAQLSQKQRRSVDIIKRNGDYLADLIEGLLDISKIEAGRLEIYRNDVKLSETLDQIVEMFKPQAMAKGIDFNYSAKYLPKIVSTDEKRLRQILINLLSNAIKYTNEGSVSFTVNYRNQVAEFIVEDTGVGIAPEHINRVLNPFERVQDKHAPNVAGTGLGLTIVKLLTEIMGGELSVESAHGNGSRFKVAMMLSSVERAPQTLVAPKPVAGFIGPEKTVLVVDDEAIHRGLITELLQPLGFKVLEAPNANTAFSFATDTANQTISAFLLDVSMPEEDGLSLAKRLRDNKITAPIIMISAEANENHDYNIASAPHDAYLVKPINTVTLLERMGDLMNITWCYEGEPKPKLTKSIATKQAQTQASDQGLLRQLVSFAECGFAKGVNQSLDALDESQNLPADYRKQLRACAEHYQFQAIINLVKKRSNA